MEKIETFVAGGEHLREGLEEKSQPANIYRDRACKRQYLQK
jgi:hypothetical protein